MRVFTIFIFLFFDTLLASPVVRLESRFGGSVNFGNGFFITDKGHVITNAHLVFKSSNMEFPETIFGYIEEGPKIPPACIAEFNPLAVDEDRDLALLEIKNYTDIYCNPLNQGFQKEYLTTNALDIAKQPICPMIPSLKTKVTFSYFDATEKIKLTQKSATIQSYIQQKDKNSSNYITGFHTDITPKKELDGALVLDENLYLLGLYSYKTKSDETFVSAKVTTKAVMVGWLCEISKNGMIKLNLKNDNGLVRFHEHPICDEFKKERVYDAK